MEKPIIKKKRSKMRTLNHSEAQEFLCDHLHSLGIPFGKRNPRTGKCNFEEFNRRWDSNKFWKSQGIWINRQSLSM